MFKSFKSKLSMVIIGIAVIPLFLSFIFVLSQIKGNLKQIQHEEVKKVAEYVKKSFEEFERNAKTYISLLKAIPDITDVVAYTVKTNDRKQLIEVLKNFYNAELCDTLQIIDAKGIVLARADKPDVYGDSKIGQNMVKSGLQGQEGSAIETGLAGYAIRIVAPIKSGGDIVGIIMIGKFLNDNFAWKISEITQSKIAFFYKEELTGSNLFDDKAVNDRMKDKVVVSLKEIIRKNNISSFVFNSEPFKFSSFPYTINNDQTKEVDVLVGISIKESLNAQSRIQAILLLLMAIVIIVASIIAQFFAQSLTKPLMSLAEQVDSWKGDFSQRITVEAKDETAKVAESFNKLMNVLTEIVNEVSRTANKVTNEAQELSASTQDINSTTQEVSSTIQKIAEGASIQAKRMEETSKIMKTMDSSSKEISLNANDTVKIAEKSLERARKVGETVALTVEKMESISRVISDAVDIIKILGSKSKEISQITETITSVAEQTNLLALNAAIEAARAGESGRGFAVVAEEVKKLAEGSALAAHKINILIKGIQSETQKAIMSIEAGYNEVKEGKRVVNESSAVLWEITDVSEQTTKMIVDMASVIQKQIGELKNVMKTMEEVASIAENNSAATEETAGSVEEVTSSMQEMSASSQELFNLALELKKMVEKFGVKEEKVEIGSVK